MRRIKGNMHGEKYLGNINTKEVHDLDKEESQCEIDVIISAGHDTPFNSLEDAHNKKFDNCAHCIGNSKR